MWACSVSAYIFLLTPLFVRTSHLASMAAKLLVVQLHGGEQIQVFQQQDCFLGDSIMTMTYPFPVSGDEFKRKRVLVTAAQRVWDRLWCAVLL